ncbi:hypothetical protein LWI28_020455 [Acer negundo]|uniref:Uncharacterized protein n=1 Tax=Acer negundo TaxID=4023 RepID=A0AAD5IFI2_ACENE|nr:hypothetical protein LWI28_020455 [Acer negundo]
MQLATHSEEMPFPRIIKWEFTQRSSAKNLLKIFTAKMWVEAKLKPMDVTLGQWYYEGIDEGGCLYPNPDSLETFHSPGPSSHPTPIRSTPDQLILDTKIIRPSETVATDTETREEVPVKPRVKARPTMRWIDEYTERQWERRLTKVMDAIHELLKEVRTSTLHGTSTEMYRDEPFDTPQQGTAAVDDTETTQQVLVALETIQHVLVASVPIESQHVHAPTVVFSDTTPM